jgi:hypothetical protein
VSGDAEEAHCVVCGGKKIGTWLCVLRCGWEVRGLVILSRGETVWFNTLDSVMI